MMDRRTFLQRGAAAAAVLSPLGTASCSQPASPKGPPRILVRSLFQDVNIGDVAQAPGLLTLLHDANPQARVVLWPGTWSETLQGMISVAFPDVEVVTSTDRVNEAMQRSDLFVHGSGPGLVGREQTMEWWTQDRSVPYSVYGITLDSPSQEDQDVLGGAASVFFRDSVSLEAAKGMNLRTAHLGYGPDSAFAFDLRNDYAAERFLRAHDLETGGFMCVIPRMRYSPYWLLGRARYDWDKDNRNQTTKEDDHRPLRDAIIEVTRKTSLRVLICPEDATQPAIGRELLYDPLPDDVKPRVVMRDDFWLPDEALSVYSRSVGLFGNEMHSPIMCVGNGIPAIVCRSAEQTSKGIMWRDIGLGDWLFDLDDPNSMAGLTAAVMSIATDPLAAQAKTEKARDYVRSRQREAMRTLLQPVKA